MNAISNVELSDPLCDSVNRGLTLVRSMNVLDTFSHGDRHRCQIWYANAKAYKSKRSDMKSWQKPINMTLRSKVNIESGSWMYTTHRLMVKHQCAKYGKPVSIPKKVMDWTQKHVKNPINWTLRSKFKVVSGSWMYPTHHFMVIHPCAKYGKPMSIQRTVMDRTPKHVKNPINLTSRSKFKAVSESWMYVTHCLMGDNKINQLKLLLSI